MQRQKISMTDFIPVTFDRFDQFCKLRGASHEYGVAILMDFWERHHRKCPACGGMIIDATCVSCSRSDDFEYEERVKEEHKKEFRNWKTYQTVKPRLNYGVK